MDKHHYADSQTGLEMLEYNTSNKVIERGTSMDVTIYHNPRCSKSRQTLELLKNNNVEPNIIEYLKTPPDKDTLKHILGLLGIKPVELLRKKEAAYKEAGLDRDNVSDDEIIAAMIKYPVLIERPIVLANGKAIIGRPPENVLTVIN